MGRAKYQAWLEPDRLALLAAWARDGMTDDQLCDKDHLAISRTTLWQWRKDHPKIANALKINKEIADIRVENALYKRALGYTAQVRKTFKVRRVKYSADGRKISEEERLEVGVDEVHIPADVTAQIYWLKNRRPEQWRDRREHAGDGREVEDLTPLADMLAVDEGVQGGGGVDGQQE